MYGTNELKLNQETMQLALQKYLNSILVGPIPKVSFVAYSRRNGYFTIYVDGPLKTSASAEK